MFIRQELPKDSQLNSEQLANMLVAQAIEQMKQLTQLSASQCEQLIKRQFIVEQSRENIISHQESDFITRLFA